MLERTTRILFLTDELSEECGEVEKELIKEVITCYSEHKRGFTWEKEEFEYHTEDKVSPSYAVDLVSELNEKTSYALEFNLHYKNSDNWGITVIITTEVFTKLDKEFGL